MNTTSRIVTALFVLAMILLASFVAACVVAAVAHYNLEWDADRANGIGNSAATFVFTVGLLVVGSRR